MESKIVEGLTKECNRIGLTDDYQINYVLNESPEILIFKGRGIGMSDVAMGKQLLKAIFPQYFRNPQKECGVMSDVDDKAEQIIDSYVRDRYTNFYSGRTKTKMISNRTGFVKFSTGAFIKSLPCKESAARSLHGDFVGDEFAFFKNGVDKGVWTSIPGMMTTGGSTTLLTTGNGERGIFFQEWMNEKSSFNKLKLPYTVCKRELYRKSVERARKNLLPLEFGQEFCCEFMPEGSRIIPFEIYAQCVNPEIKFGSEIVVKDGAYYVMGIDFARKHDKTQIVVLEIGDRVVTAFIKEFENTKYSTQLDYIVYLNSMLPSLIKINVDKTTVGIPLTEDLISRIGSKVEGITFSVPTKEGLFQVFKNALVDKIIELPPLDIVKNQIVGMRKTITEFGNSHYEGDEDDLFWAYALAMKAVPQNKFEPFKAGIVPRDDYNHMASIPAKMANSRWRGMHDISISNNQLTTRGDFGRPEV